MKTKVFLSILAVVLIVSAYGQNLELTFTAIEDSTNVQLDSIKVMNRTQGVDTMLYWPDTVLILYHVGICDKFDENSNFVINQNYPNPVVDQTMINFRIPEKGDVKLTITDVMGRQVISTKRILEKGYHEFSFKPGNSEIYFFTVSLKEVSQSIKIINAGLGGYCSLNYMGSREARLQTKSTVATQEFSFILGDKLLYIGNSDTMQSGMLDTPEESQTYTFQFATNIPCPGTPTVEYEGQIYNTIQIFSQCWLKENLNVGMMILGAEDMTDNDTIEKYCYNNEMDSCIKYGGLYQWNEIMQYTTQQGVQGICPPGWHIPTDEEWKVLEGAVDGQYSIGDVTWDIEGFSRGFDVGKNLKSTSGWNGNGNGTDLFSFSSLPGGYRFYGGTFNEIGKYGFWWTATESISTDAWLRYPRYNYDKVDRVHRGKGIGDSIRCVKD